MKNDLYIFRYPNIHLKLIYNWTLILSYTIITYSFILKESITGDRTKQRRLACIDHNACQSVLFHLESHKIIKKPSQKDRIGLGQVPSPRQMLMSE